MRYLIDTNLFINIVEDKYISDDVRYILYDYVNTIYLSSESIKEFIHLAQNGKIAVPKNKKNTSIDVFHLIENEMYIKIKYVREEHLKTFAQLASVEGHNDPSDRLIIAQAITEKLTLISSDTKFPKYRKQGLDLIQNRK